MILHKLKKIGYEHLKSRSKSFRTKNFIFYYSTEPHTLCSNVTHVGFTVTKKNVRKAVDRNRVKRLIRAGLSRFISQSGLHDDHSTHVLSKRTSLSKSIHKDSNAAKKVESEVENKVQKSAVKNQQNAEQNTQENVNNNIQPSLERKTDTISLLNIVYARKSDSVSSLSLNEVHSDIEHFFTEKSKDSLLKCN